MGADGLGMVDTHYADTHKNCSDAEEPIPQPLDWLVGEKFIETGFNLKTGLR